LEDRVSASSFTAACISSWLTCRIFLSIMLCRLLSLIFLYPCMVVGDRMFVRDSIYLLMPCFTVSSEGEELSFRSRIYSAA
jgi:hypothetical protein